MGVQIIEAVITLRGHYEVAARVSYHPLKVVFVVPPRWSTELVIK